MVNGSNFVYNYLDRHKDIRRNISRKIINTRSLAKYIHKENPELNMSTTGIITAIRRYSEGINSEKNNIKIDNIFKNTILEMGFGYRILNVLKTEYTLNLLNELLKKINLRGNSNINVVMSKSSFALYFDIEKYDLIIEELNDAKILYEIKDIGMIKLKFGPIIDSTPNVFATILNEIGMNHINVIDVYTKRDKMMIYVSEKDLMNCSNIIHKLLNEVKTNKEG